MATTLRDANDVLQVLEHRGFCHDCKQRKVNLLRAMGYVSNLRQRKRQDTLWAERLAAAVADVVKTAEAAEVHLFTCDAEAPAAVPSTPRAPAVRVTCERCGREWYGDKIPRRHRTALESYADWCSPTVNLTELPPVVMRPSPRSRAVTGHCHACDRPVSGERRFCGPCLASRGRL